MTEQVPPTLPDQIESLVQEIRDSFENPKHEVLAKLDQLLLMHMEQLDIAYTRGIRSNERLVEEAVAQADGMQTSIIRATVAAVMEEVNTVYNHGGERFALNMNLEAQRTIWDRYELTTERDASQENVIFTIHKK